FFFQAEDGIRDRNVTGVQTCALPISWSDLDIKRQAQSAAEDMVRQEAATTGQLEFPGKPTVKVDNFRELEIVAAKEVTEKQEQSEEHTSELQSRFDLVRRLLLDRKK